MADQHTNAHQPTCLMSHSFLNRLSVIIGSCDIVLHEAEASGSIDSQTMRRLTVVRGIAWELVNDLRQHECRLDAATRALLISGDAANLGALESVPELTAATSDIKH